jgi:hypothetical protein
MQMGVYYAMPVSDAVESYLRVPPMLVLLSQPAQEGNKEKGNNKSMMLVSGVADACPLDIYESILLDGQRPEGGASSKKRNMNRVTTRIRAPSLLEKRRGKEVKHVQSPSETSLT